MISQLRALSLPLAVAALALAACGPDSGAAGDAQVAATVNGQSIAFRQITRPIRPGNGEAPPPNQEAFAALDRLIDQELFAQRAREMRLDQDPAVQVELEAARHHILAQSYIDRSMRVVEVTPEEIGRFYQEHPILFEQRRVYYFQELTIAVGSEHLEAFRQLVAASTQLDEIAAWLREHGLAFQRAMSIKTTEHLPPGVLPRLAAMQNAQLEVFEDDGTLTIVQLMMAQPAPVGLSEASPFIEKMLLAEKRQAFMRDKARQLRDKAEIRYLGPFAQRPAPQSPPAPAGKEEPHINKGPSGVL